LNSSANPLPGATSTETLAAYLVRQGVDLSAGHAPAVLEWVQGRFLPEHADTLEAHARVVLVAQRTESADPGRIPPWELHLLRQFLSRQPLLPAGGMREMKVSSMNEADLAMGIAAQLVQAEGAGRAVQEAAGDITYELLVNALLDAPVNAEGFPKYAHQREANPQIDSADACRLQLAVAEGRLFIGVTDRYGRLGPRPFARVLRTFGGKVKVDPSGGGAGLGLRRIVDASDAVAVRVGEGRMTEVCAVLNLEEVRRRAAGLKSFMFHRERG
jgi:hypothetical protein